MKIVDKNGLKISSILFEFINNEVIPGTEVSTDKFWNSFAKTVTEQMEKLNMPETKRLTEE